MLLVAILFGALMFWIDWRVGFSPHVLQDQLDEKTCGLKPTHRLGERLDQLVLLACLLFILGYFLSLIHTLSSAALVGDNALTYHLPSAAQWLQTGRLGLYNTWFFNPANTYSPLAGSTFLVWLIAPIGTDLIAQFAQMPALILIFLAIVQIARSLGVRVSIGALAATGALLSRPFISEAILVKDDQFLAAFFLAAVAGCASERLKDRLGPWRIGIAIGLFFATKYTALLTAPIFLLLIDAPFRARHQADLNENELLLHQRRIIGLPTGGLFWWFAVLGSIVIIAGPWYVRNWILTANPLYPVPIGLPGVEIFKGMFIPERSTEMRTLAGAWHALTGGFHSPSQLLMDTLLILWIIAIILHARKLLANPLLRVCLIGPALGLTIFFLASHAALIRYAYPSLLLLFLCATLVKKDKG